MRGEQTSYTQEMYTATSDRVIWDTMCDGIWFLIQFLELCGFECD